MIKSKIDHKDSMLKKLFFSNLCFDFRVCGRCNRGRFWNFFTETISVKILFSVLRGFGYICISIPFSALVLHGSSIELNPVRLEFLPGQKITSQEITNHSGVPVVLQLKVVKWKKVLGKDIHEETNDVIVTPPLITLDSEEKQLVRLGMRVTPDEKKGATYRLIINELPASNLLTSFGVRTLLEFQVPIVAAPLVPSKPKILWAATRLGDKKIKITIQNVGESYLSLCNISLSNSDENKPFVKQPITYYILPGQKQDYEFDLPNAFKGRNVQISAQTDQGEVKETVSLSNS